MAEQANFHEGVTSVQEVLEQQLARARELFEVATLEYMVYQQEAAYDARIAAEKEIATLKSRLADYAIEHTVTPIDGSNDDPDL